MAELLPQVTTDDVLQYGLIPELVGRLPVCSAHQLLTHRPGGWPLTMFIDPHDQRPFFGGTYFPPESRHGLPSFRDLLVRAADFFREQRDDVKGQGEQLAQVFERLEPVSIDAKIDEQPLHQAREKIGQSFDREYGGIGNAPKFPHPTTLDRLLRHWRATAHSEQPDVDALFLVSLTLTRMAEGGIYDHLGGGFCRYSVDRYWQIPHFEKMLYDNGPLLALYAQAALATGDESFARVANETADWMRGARRRLLFYAGRRLRGRRRQVLRLDAGRGSRSPDRR